MERPAWRDVGAVLVCIAVLAGAVGAYREFAVLWEPWSMYEDLREGGLPWAMRHARGCGWGSLALGAIGLAIAMRRFPHQVRRGSFALLMPPSVVLLAALPTVVMAFVDLGGSGIVEVCIMLFLEHSLLSCALQCMGLALLVAGLQRREVPPGPKPLALATLIAALPALVPAPFFSAAIVSEGFFHITVALLLGGWTVLSVGVALLLIARGRPTVRRLPLWLCLCGALTAGPGTLIALLIAQGGDWASAVQYGALLAPTAVVALPAALGWYRALPGQAQAATVTG